MTVNAAGTDGNYIPTGREEGNASQNADEFRISIRSQVAFDVIKLTGVGNIKQILKSELYNASKLRHQTFQR